MMDIDDMRRRAPLHFWAKADNARYCAWTLWSLEQSGPTSDPSAIGYRGTPEAALHEGWRRERSLALECIIKAVFAQREEGKPEPRVVRPTHNVSQLWGEAGLPKVNREDRIRLLMTWEILQWAGRYAAPRDGGSSHTSELSRLTRQSGSLASRLPAFGWSEFDALYQRAVTGFYAARAKVWGDDLV